MSLIRIARPGYPVQLIDEGPNQARVSSRLGIKGGGPYVVTGSLVVGESAKTLEARQSRQWNAAHKAPRGEALLEKPRVKP